MEHYDERQKLERGRAFQWGFFACILTDGILCLLTTYGVTFEQYTLFLFAIWPPAVICITQMIWRDAYEGVHESGGKIGMTAALLCGLLLVMRTVARGEALMPNGVLADGAAMLCTGLCATLIGVVYWCKQLWDRLRQKKE